MSQKEEMKVPAFASNLSWYLKPEDKASKSSKFSPCARWGHSSAAVEKNVYIYGGTGDKVSPKYWEGIYKLDLETWEWTKLEIEGNAPTPRDSHSMTFYKDKLYVFGGSCDNASTNELFEFDLTDNSWKFMSGRGSPSPREGHSSCIYQDRYLVVYGGLNEEQTLNDCYLFDFVDKIWLPAQSDGMAEPESRESHSCTLVGDYMYIFGGQGNSIIQNSESMELFFNDLYRLKIQFVKNVPKLYWEKLEPKGLMPAQRSSHSACVYKEKYIFIVGGEGYSTLDFQAPSTKDGETESEYLCFPKNDIWSYDIEFNQWLQLKTKNDTIFTARFAHTCDLYDEYLVIFGGLKDYQYSSNDVYVLSLNGQNPITLDTTNQLRDTLLSYQDKETKTFKGRKGKIWENNSNLTIKASISNSLDVQRDAIEEEKLELQAPSVSTGFLSTLSNNLSWPLAAFGLLLDNSLINKASSFKIDVRRRPRKSSIVRNITNEEMISYLIIEDDGFGWDHESFIELFMNHKVDPQKSNISSNETELKSGGRKSNEYAFNLKTGGFRLGKTLIYISRNDDEISLAFLSTEKKYNPDVHNNHVFLYSWKTTTQEFTTSQAQRNKDIIMNALAGLFTEEDLVRGIEDISNRLLILDLHCVPVFNKPNGSKTLDYEILLYPNKIRSNDICIRTLDKKLNQFILEPNNYLIELSLRTYFSYFFLDPSSVSTKVFIKGEEVPFIKVKEILQKDPSGKDSIKVINEGSVKGQILEAYLPKKSKEEKILSGNQGVLVYYENRLFRRLEDPKLGNLDFLSLRIRELQSTKLNLTYLFAKNGYIEVGVSCKPNFFKTEIEDPYYSHNFYLTIINKLAELGNTLNEKRRGEGELDEFETISKKVKASPSLKVSN